VTPTLILFPVFAQVALTFVLLAWMARGRIGSLKTGVVKIKDIALGQDGWPPKVQQVSRSFASQFELPMLFYAVAAFAMLTKHVDLVLLALAWLFVALRFAHAYVHTSSNHLPMRFNIFAAGMLTLAAMWLWFAVRITMASV
jgi:hypothetical protein